MTTLVQADWFGVGYTDQEAQLLANRMAVTPYYYAEVSCEGDRLFGLVTVCKRETCQGTCETVLNGCARKNLWQYSYMVQQELEASLGWTLSPRYVREEIPWDGEHRVRLTFGGVTELFKTESVTIVDEDVTYNPYVYQATVQAVLGQSYTEVLIPQGYINTPEGVMMRNPNTGKAWAFEDIPGYPELRTIGPDKFWAIAIPGGNATAGDTVDILDCKWGYIDAPNVECDDEVAVVYQDSVQQIPVAKVTADRWYILHRYMVRPEYQDAEIDLTHFQVYKLYDVVDIGCFGESCELITVHKKCVGTDTECLCDADNVPCDEIEVDACATIINAEAGIIEIHEVEVITDDNGDPVLDSSGCPTFRQITTDCTECAYYEPYKVTVPYKTSPVQSGISNTSSVETLRHAIAARVAAEVVLVDCGCVVECGFFKDMRQEVNTTVFTQNGSIIVSARFGNRMGQQKYALALETAPRNQPVVIA